MRYLYDRFGPIRTARTIRDDSDGRRVEASRLRCDEVCGQGGDVRNADYTKQSDISMPIQENALNSALAEALSGHDLHATPEQTQAKSGAKRCDVQIRRRHGDRYFTALECKIGQSATQRQAAVRDAQRWLKQSDCWNAIALCYPEELSEDRQATPRQTLEVTRDLLMVKVSQGSTIGHWRKGRLSDLEILADDVGANETYAVTDILQRAIVVASEELDSATARI